MSEPAAPLDAPPGQPRKAAMAAWIGSALEYYDFFIYGSAAALIFPKVFFDDSDPATATLQSLATFGVAYAARPVGALFLGHFGDRLGRKKIMVFTLVLMGLSTFLIGCLPTRAQVGGIAPVLLVLCRVLQGISAAGEQAGANSMTLEHAPPERRGFFTSFTLSGTQGGQLIATLVFLAVATMPRTNCSPGAGVCPSGRAWPSPWSAMSSAAPSRRLRPSPGRRRPKESSDCPSPCCSASTGRTCCAWSRVRSSPRSARSSRCGRWPTAPVTRSASPGHRCCGSARWPTWSPSARYPPGPCSPTASAAAPCI